MDRRRAAGVLLALAACFACSAAAPTASNQTALDLYEVGAGGCYYNFQHYGEGDRIMTNEPCLNCTCHNRMLMCYLRVCPFTKPIGQDCTVEKRADQCCPIVTCPDVPVDLLTSTSTTSPAEYGATGVGKVDKYGCSISGKYFPEGSKVPPTPNKPCEHCYCIRNMTTCVMQECTLHVDGCTPIYHKDVCCPVRYSCDHPEDEIPLLDDMSTTIRPTPGFLLTTTTESPVTQMTQDCVHDDQIFADGRSIKTEKPCEHCYCMKGDIVCVVQECGTPMENEGKNCTSLPPREGQCCPDTYICEGDVISTDSLTEPTTETISDKITTLLPPMRGGVEGSGYRLEPDESSNTVAPTESEFEGSGDEKEITSVFEPVTSEKPIGSKEQLPAQETDEDKKPELKEPEKTTEVSSTVSELDTQTPQTNITTTTPKKEDFEKLTTSEIKEEEILAPHDRVSTSAPADESYEGATTEISETLITESDDDVKKETISSDSTSAPYEPSSETTTLKQVDDIVKPISTGYDSLTTISSAENVDKLDKDSAASPEILNVTPSSVTIQDETSTPTDFSSLEHKQPTTTEKYVKEIVSPSSEIYLSSTVSTLDKAATEPDHAENTIAVAEEDNTHDFAPGTTTKSILEEENKSTPVSEYDVTETTGDKEAHKPIITTETSINEVKVTTEEPDKGLNTIPNETDDKDKLGSALPTTTSDVELKPTESSMFESLSKVPDVTATKGDQYTVTTEPSFRKEDDMTVSTEKQKEVSTVKPEFIDDGLIPTSSQDDRYDTGSEVSHTEDDFTTSIPDFVETTEPKESTTESYPQTSIIPGSLPDQISEVTGKPEYEIPSSTEKTEGLSSSVPVVTETDEEGSRIPGEGDCLLEGITYRNNTVVPSSNNCHAGCKCVSSIIKCEPIICSPPPNYNGNCQTIYDSPDSCCPTYVCDHARETVPPQSDNQMSGTESPMAHPTIECHGDQCELNPPKIQPTEPICGPEGCGADAKKPDLLEPSSKEPTECTGDHCATPSQDCSSSDCRLPTSDDQLDKHPSQPCNGNNCKDQGQATSPGSQDSSDVPCQGDSCHKVDCATSGCEPAHIPYPIDTKNITSDDCIGDMPCRRKETAPNNTYLPAKCEGPNCVKETELTTAHSIDSSTLKQTPPETATENAPTEPPTYPASVITTERIKDIPTEADDSVKVTETPERKPELSSTTEESLVHLPEAGITVATDTEQENTVSVEDSHKPTDFMITGEPELQTQPPSIKDKVTKPITNEDENKPYSSHGDQLGTTEPTTEVKIITQGPVQPSEPSTVSPILVEQYSTYTPSKADTENTVKPEIDGVEQPTSPALEEKSTVQPVDDKTEAYTIAYESTEKSTVTEGIRTEPTDVVSSRKPEENLTEKPMLTEQQEHKEPVIDSATEKLDEMSSETDKYHDDSTKTTTPKTTEGITEVMEKLTPTDVTTQKPDVKQEEEHKPTHDYDQNVTKPEETVTTSEEVTDKTIGVSITEITSSYEKEHSTQGLEMTSTEKIDIVKDKTDESYEASTKPTFSLESTTKPDLSEDNQPEKSTEEYKDTEIRPTIDENKDQKITPSMETESDKPISTDEKATTGQVMHTTGSTDIPTSAETHQQGSSTGSDGDVTTITPVIDKKYTPIYDENKTETLVTLHDEDGEHKDKPTSDQEVNVNIGDSIKENESTEEPSITENQEKEKPVVDDLKKPILINEDDKEVTMGPTESGPTTESDDNKNKETLPDTEKPFTMSDATVKPIMRDDETKTTPIDVKEQSTKYPIVPAIITEKPQELETPEEGSGSEVHLPEDSSKPATTESTIEHETNVPEKISTVGIELSPSEEATKAPQITTDASTDTASVSADELQKTTASSESVNNFNELTTKPQELLHDITESPQTVPPIAAKPEENTNVEKINEDKTEQPLTEVTPLIDTRDQGTQYDTTSQKSDITNALPESTDTYVTTEPSVLQNKPDKENIDRDRPEGTTEKEVKIPESTTPVVTEPVHSYTEEEGSKATSPSLVVTGYPEKPTDSESVVTQKADQDLDIANTTPKASEKPISDIDQEYTTAIPTERETLKPTESATTDSQTQQTPGTLGYTTSEEVPTSKPDLIKEQSPITEIPQQLSTESDDSNTVSDSGHVQISTEEKEPTVTDKIPIDGSSATPKEDTKVTISEPVTDSYVEPHNLATTGSPVEVSTIFDTMASVEPSGHITSEAPLSLVTGGEIKPTGQIYVPVEPEKTLVPVTVTESELRPETVPQDEKITERPIDVTSGEIATSIRDTPTELTTVKIYTDSVLREVTTTKHIEDIGGSTEPTVQSEFSETTPYLIELEEHTHKIQDDNLTPTSSEETTITDEQLSTISPLLTVGHDQTVRPDSETESQPSVTTEKAIQTETGSSTPEPSRLPDEESSPLPVEQDKESEVSEHSIASTTSKPLMVSEEEVTKPQVAADSSTESTLSEQAPSETEKPKEPMVPHENVTPEEEFIFSTTKATTLKQEDEQQTQNIDDKFSKPDEKPLDTELPHPPPTIPEVTSKPADIQPTDEVPSPEEEGHFPPSGSSGYGEPDYPEEDQAFGPGTCRYGGKVYVSAQQIPRDDPCDFCFCFRSDIICLQQSCPPPIHGCHEEPIQGFCCPRYECPVSMATSVNVTTTTTTTTTTLPPHFLAHAYKGAAQRRGCQIKGHTYKVGEVVRSSSGPCLHCTCGGDGQMKCDPKACTPEPMLRQMIAAAVSAKRRR